MNKPGPRPFLTPAAVRAAYIVYRAGMSTGEISRKIHKRYGYHSADSCSKALRKAFRMQGYVLRSPSERAILREGNPPCTGCGCQIGERTPGCQPCNKRASHFRLHRGLPYPEPSCARCGVPYSQRTKGCHTCSRRHWSAAKRALTAVSLRDADVWTAGEGTSVPRRGGSSPALLTAPGNHTEREAA